MSTSTALRALGIVALLQISVFAASNPRTKKLIEFGWDEPGTDFMREHIAQMEKAPFDGCVFHVDYAKAAGGKGSFTWECWGTNAFTQAQLLPALDDLKATRFRRFTHNFLRFNTTPAKLDWFDDHSAVLTNAWLAARLARDAKIKGLLFDIEQYAGQLFDYRKQRDVKQKGWEVYAAQVRQRGREVMEAFQRGYPDLTVFLTFGYSLPWAESSQGKGSLAECHYGLLAPFLDGMLDAAKGKVQFVDGHEISYGWKEAERFPKAYETMRETLLPIVLAIAKRTGDGSHSASAFGWIRTGASTAGASRIRRRIISVRKRSNRAFGKPSKPRMNTSGFTPKPRVGGRRTVR